MLKMVDGTGIIGVDMVCPLGGTVSPPQPPNYDKVEMEGVGSLMLPNSLKAPLERLELIGNSTQGENPAPDNPQEIKSAGRFDEASGKYLFDVKVTGKNLLSNKPTDWMIGKATSWGAVPQTPVSYGTNVKNAIATINVKSSTNYSFINKDTNKLWVYRIIEQDENGLGYVNHPFYKDESLNYKKYNFSTRSNTSNIVFEIKKVDGTELLSSDIESIKIMLVEGEVNEPTIYEPYTEQSVQIALNEPLRGIGDYKDTITKDGVVRKIKRAVFDGSEDEKWGLSREHENHINFALVIKGAITVNTGIRTMMDKFKYFGAIWNSDLLGQDMFGATLRINMPKTLATDLQTFKTWLSQNPLTVDYVLAEPVTEPLPESVQAQLQALHSENGVTHVFVDSGEVPCGIKLTYRKEK
ncbi:hypothetical protein HMPREF1216_00478 [Coprococcus sp. HPP0048]|nr:hypothetical protein HMPREF1216_00478 [Coprococcus sp. HPP0048]